MEYILKLGNILETMISDLKFLLNDVEPYVFYIDKEDCVIVVDDLEKASKIFGVEITKDKREDYIMLPDVEVKIIGLKGGRL